MAARQVHHRRFHLTPIAAAIVCAGFGGLVCAAPALAEDQSATRAGRAAEKANDDESARLEPVTVNAPEQASSTKFTAPLLNTPQTFSVIPREIFGQQAAQNLGDVLRNTPGITYNAGENGFATGPSNFSIRGFESGSNVFIDGARDSGNYVRDIFNVERVEVAKGPASDNGRGGAGGYVNLVTKTPTLQDSYSGSVSYGTDSHDADARKRVAIDLNQVLDDSTAFRVNLLRQTGGVPGIELAEKTSWGIAPSIAFGLGTPMRFTLAYQYVKQDDRPDFGVPGALLPGLTPNANPGNSALPRAVSRDNFYGHVDDFDEVSSHSLLGRFELDISPNVKFSNSTRWSDTDRLALYTVVGATSAAFLVTPARQSFDRENKAVTNQSNFTINLGSGSLSHTISTGVDIANERSESGRNVAGLGTLTTTDLFNPDPRRPVTGLVDLTPQFTDKVEIDSVGAYLYDTIEFSEQWQLTGGVRADHYRVRIRSNDPALNPPTAGMPYARDETNLTGKLGVVYKPADNASIYAAWGISVLPPGSFLSHPDASRPGGQSLPTLGGQNFKDGKEQKSINSELGVKWDFFDSRLSTTAAVFRTERKDIAMAPVDGVPTGYGRQIVQGVELGVVGAITEAWSVFGGVVFLDSERRHSDAIDAVLRATTPADYGSATTTDGDELAFTPKRSANLWTTYRLPFGLTVGGGAQHVSDSWVGRPDNVDRVIANGVTGKMPGYTIVNLMAAYPLGEHTTLRLNVENVGDKLYGTSANWSARRVQLGNPRNYVLSADLRF